MRLDPKPSRLHHCHPPPSNCFTGASRTDSLLGGGALARTVATGVILGAGALPEGALAVVEVWPNHAITAGPPWPIFATTSE
jgi:hypothetical protein